MFQIVTERVAILLQKIYQGENVSPSRLSPSGKPTRAIVRHRAGEMFHAEDQRFLRLSRRLSDEVFIFAVLLLEFGAESLIGTLRNDHLLVDHRNDAHAAASKQIDDVLIIDKGDFVPIHSFFLVFCLFQFEDMMNEKLL